MDVIEAVKKEGFRRRYSINTIVSYCDHITGFLDFCKKEPRYFTKKDIKDYLDSLSSRNMSSSTLNLSLSALKFMMKTALNKDWRLEIKYSRKPKTIPVVMTKNEVIRLLSSIKNEKHRLILSLMYGSGLRLSELLKLKVRDIELFCNYGWIRHGKGNKDRRFIIAQKLRPFLNRIVEELNPDDYLFIGRYAHLSRKTVYELVRNAAINAGITKNIHPHTLRHSFATHMIENGYDVYIVQRLLGHESIETTQGYIHIAMPKLTLISPFDDLYKSLF
jgi:integrase/recombinase XerD